MTDSNNHNSSSEEPVSQLYKWGSMSVIKDDGIEEFLNIPTGKITKNF